MDADSPYSDCFYNHEKELTNQEVAAFVTDLIDVSEAAVVELREELRSNERFQTSLERSLQTTEFRPTGLKDTWRDVLYVVVRVLEPSTVVETGVFDGLSSMYLLQGLRDNQQGELISIDIEEETILPSDIDPVETGWAVPEYLRSRWDLRIGDARELLPDVAAEREVDLFLHDSNHDAEHMRFEFTTVEPSMPAGAVLMADNVEYNRAFDEFADESLGDVAVLTNAEKSLQRDGGTVEDDKLGAGVVD